MVSIRHYASIILISIIIFLIIIEIKFSPRISFFNDDKYYYIRIIFEIKGRYGEKINMFKIFKIKKNE